MSTWSRDEIILALDVLEQHDTKELSLTSTPIVELSRILNKLPIVPISKRKDYFRNCAGVRQQLLRFYSSAMKGLKASHINQQFYDVHMEFQGKQEYLHQIATAIRRNADSFSQIGFGTVEETCSFPEGALLGHLHRYIEARDLPPKLASIETCQICGISLSDIYDGILHIEGHLTVLPTDLVVHTTYKAENFISVCPNCHAALHRLRPWRTAEDCEQILKE